MLIKKFEDIVGRCPGKAAIKTANQSLTYTELDFKANRAAHAVAAAGKDNQSSSGGKTQQVALLFDYGIDMIVGILGTLKANKTYVPLDFSYPGKRLLYIIENAGVELILTDNRNHDLACELSAHAGTKIDVLNMNTIGDEIPGTAIHREASEERIAYILYTSGSTGKPKGVFQTHRNVMYYTRNWINRFSITESERMSLFTSFTHDGAVQDIFSTLLSGACLYPYSLKQTGRVEELYMLLAKEKITLWHSTPSLFRYFAGVLTGEDRFPDVRWVLLGGEPLRAHDLELYKTYFPGAVLANVYGQTESSVSTICVLTRRDTFDDITLGEPLDETKIFLIDEDGDMVEEMGGGEIIVACDYIAPGYWQDEANSQKVFLHDEQWGRFYRTGDIGRFTAQGSIKAMGRKDFQVKIRGFRIELGEIETGLLQHYAVKEAIVIAIPDETGDNYLCAYIVTSQSVSSEDLREYLFMELPDYMVPRYFIFMEELPVTSTGKIDRRQLPEPGKIIDTRFTYVPPADEIEEQVAAIWQEVLKIEKIGVNDNFIELGGQSLLIMSIISKIHRELDVELKLTDVFANPTIKELSRLVKESKPAIFSSIIPVEEKEYYLLSSSQKRLYILQQMSPNSTAYHLPEIFPLPVGTDPGKVNETFKRGIKRHESLRTSFHMVKDTLVQRIHKHVEFEIENYDIDAGGTESPAEKIRQFVRPFDLSGAPLLRVGILKTGDENLLLLVDMHHIISDGFSLDILEKDYEALYNDEEIPPLRLQYKDFSEWRKGEREQGNLKQQEEFWLKEFEGEVPVLDLPYDYPRPLIQSFEGNIVGFEIAAEETRALNTVALQGGATLFMALAAVFNILLSKLSGQEEIVMGTPIAGRRHADLEKIIGMFVNTLALRNYPAGDRTFRQFQKDIKEKMFRVFENQEYPFEELVDKLSVKRDIGRNPLFDIMFISQNMNTYSANQDKETGIEITQPVQPAVPKEYEDINKTVKFDLTLTVRASDHGLSLLLLYCTKLFKKETIERFIFYFKTIVSKVVKEPEIKISDIEIVSEEEKNRLLYEFNETGAIYPKNKTIQQLFEEQAERIPDHIVVVGSSAQITYNDLNEKSNRLAHVIKEKGIHPDMILGIKVGRSLEMIIGILGILKSGGAYLPVDPDYPQERVDYMLKDSGAKILLTTQEIAGLFSPRAFNNRPKGTNSINNLQLKGNSLAYVIFTSGSTGKPKGVMIEHRAVHNFMEGMARIIEFNPGKIILALTTITFDIFGLETLLPLCRGLKLVLADENHQREMGLLEQLVVKNCVGMMQTTPARMQMFTMTDSGRSCLKNLKELMVGGEALPLQLLVELKQFTPAKIYNMYGPTETTIWSTVKDLTGAEEINIGTPIQNTMIYILDKHDHIQPVGVSGELCIGGDGLARGYINRPQLTADRFYRSYKSNRSYIIYKTGDLARWLPDGNIQFLGRIDHQVKVRGYRIEPEEIEELLLTHEQIKEAVVVIKSDSSLDKSLCAYLLPDLSVSTSPPNPADLREMLADKLPAYMIPSYFVILEKMPLTPGGKIDRKYLIQSGPSYSRSGTAVTFVEPANHLEKIIARIWKEILHIEEVGIHDNFFDLGGNSMKLLQLGLELKNAFGVDIPVALMFRNLTVNFLSKYLAPKEIDTGKNRKQSEALDRARNTFKDTISKLIKE